MASADFSSLTRKAEIFHGKSSHFPLLMPDLRGRFMYGFRASSFIAELPTGFRLIRFLSAVELSSLPGFALSGVGRPIPSDFRLPVKPLSSANSSLHLGLFGTCALNREKKDVHGTKKAASNMMRQPFKG